MAVLSQLARRLLSYTVSPSLVVFCMMKRTVGSSTRSQSVYVNSGTLLPVIRSRDTCLVRCSQLYAVVGTVPAFI